MSAIEVDNVTSAASGPGVTMKLEVQVIPVSDVDRSKGFYEQLGWRLDDDIAPLDALRIVQFTPPGSGASVTFGRGINDPDGNMWIVQEVTTRLPGRGDPA
jgi:predicted lactoylglutathione lyase